MRVEQGIVAAIEAESPTIVGSRIYAGQLPPNPTYPAITYSRVSTSQGALLNGPDTLTRVGIQFDVWSDSVSEAKDTALALRTMLNGYQGSLGGVAVQYVEFGSEIDSSTFEGDWEVRRIILDFGFWLHE